MPTPGERKTVQARILLYAQDIGWGIVPRAEAEQRRGFDFSAFLPSEQARHASLFFDDLLYRKARQFNPLYTATPSARAKSPAGSESLMARIAVEYNRRG